MQITPRVFAPFNPRSLAGGEKTEKGWPAESRRKGVAGGEARGGGAKGVQAAPSGARGAMGDGRRRRIGGGGKLDGMVTLVGFGRQGVVG